MTTTKAGIRLADVAQLQGDTRFVPGADFRYHSGLVSVSRVEQPPCVANLGQQVG